MYEKIFVVIKMLYSKRLKELRERLGLSQNKIANLIDLDSGTFSNYENEKIIIPLKHLNTLCNYFNVSIDYIFELTNIKNYNNINNNIDKIEVGKRLKNFRKENKLTQEKLANLLNTTHSVISAYEKGKNLIATPFLYTICKNYKISADYILGKIDSPKYLY